MKTFSLKFIDIMIGIILGLGFNWWPMLHQPWQYIAFIFSYFVIVDYWIDYSPSLRKFPPRREFDVLLDLGVMFSLFLFIYASQRTVAAFLASYALHRTTDFFWLLNARHDHRPSGAEKRYLETWMRYNVVEVLVLMAIIGVTKVYPIDPLIVVITFIVEKVLIRAFGSIRNHRAFLKG